MRSYADPEPPSSLKRGRLPQRPWLGHTWQDPCQEACLSSPFNASLLVHLRNAIRPYELLLDPQYDVPWWPRLAWVASHWPAGAPVKLHNDLWLLL